MSKKNSWKWNVVAMAVTVAAAATFAQAQEITLRATIPFAFSISKYANLAPGKYVVTHDREVWRFRSMETNQSVSILNTSGHQGQLSETPSLTFDCLGAHCQLRAINAGGGALGAEVPAPKYSISDKQVLASVVVRLQ